MEQFMRVLNAHSSNVLMNMFVNSNSLAHLSVLKEHIDYRIIFGLEEEKDFNIDMYVKLEKRIKNLSQRIPQEMAVSGACSSSRGNNNDGATNISVPLHFKNIVVYRELEHEIKKFELTSRRYQFGFKDFDDCSDPISWLKEGLSELMDHGMRSFQPDDRIGLIFNNAEIPDRPLSISFRRRDQLTADVVLDTFGNVLQSNATFFVDNELSLTVYRIKLPSGSGRCNLKGASFEEFCRRKTGIVAIDNSDNLCLAYALALGIAYKQNEVQFIKLKNSREMLTDAGKQLCIRAGVDLSEGASHDHITRFQDLLNEYTIVVYNNRKGSTTYFEGPRSKNRQVINLLLDSNHYNLILSLTAAFAAPYFCEMCKKRFHDKRKHSKCPYICPCCHMAPPYKITEESITCNSCNRTFRGKGCLDSHKTRLCSKVKRCNLCLSSYWVDKKKPHECGVKYCTICLEIKPVRHFCFMKPKTISKKNQEALKQRFIFVFFDFECRQEKEITNNIFLHEPNLCVAEQVCAACINNENINIDCCVCGKRLNIFKSDPVGEFLEYLHIFESKKYNVTAIAHNMKGYDGCFIARRVLSDVNRWNPSFIRNGCKFISITCNNIRFIDSLNYMALPLSKLPAAFKFSAAKGYFPHLFNKRENKYYIGPLPDSSFYMPDSMPSKERDAFFEWYDEQISNNVIFNMASEIIKYCVMDVDVLRKACIKFRQCFLDANKVDPFQESTTIPGACNLVFRKNFLKPNTIGIIPQGGYRLADKQSGIALQWLAWLKHCSNTEILHAGNSREVRLPAGILVDGFCKSTNTVYEFYGCYYHGCEKCFYNQTSTGIGNKQGKKKKDFLFIRREETEAREKRLLELGYTIEKIWECEFRELLKCNRGIQNFLDQNNYIYSKQPLNPRDAFFGGRTNAVKLYYKCNLEEDETICYFDVCSIYPFVNKYGKYPTGHPKIIVGDAECRKYALDTIEGLIKCTILPPDNLYHPVLPYKCHGKLTFPLCRTCVEALHQEECRHKIDERKFTGTFVADELRKAVSLGYRILEFLEIWQYKVEIYDRQAKSGGLFAGYVDNFLKIKQECSGWPRWCTTDELKKKYVDSYAAREGIKLDPPNISHNAGMRYIAKTMLNSFWGKFGQRENLMQTSVLQEPIQLFNLLTDPSVNLHDIIIIDDQTLLACWDKREDAVTPLRTVNVALAAYTTASARLELYGYLEKLGERVLYFDTDSIIFIQNPGQWAPETGDYLGQLTDEIAEYGPGSKIVEFVSGGPKNYALKIFSSNENKYVTICKVKGITLNFKNSQTVNFETMKAMVCDNAAAERVFNDRKISRTSTYDIVSKPEAKVFRVSYTKRRRIENSFDTLPYGYRKI